MTTDVFAVLAVSACLAGESRTVYHKSSIHRRLRAGSFLRVRDGYFCRKHDCSLILALEASSNKDHREASSKFTENWVIELRRRPGMDVSCPL